MFCHERQSQRSKVIKITLVKLRDLPNGDLLSSLENYIVMKQGAKCFQTQALSLKGNTFINEEFRFISSEERQINFEICIQINHGNTKVLAFCKYKLPLRCKSQEIGKWISLKDLKGKEMRNRVQICAKLGIKIHCKQSA